MTSHRWIHRLVQFIALFAMAASVLSVSTIIDAPEASATTDPGVDGSSLLLWAKDEINIRQGAALSSNGSTVDVVAENAAAPPKWGIAVRDDASTGPDVRLIADRVKVDGPGSVAGDVFYNHRLRNDGTIGGALVDDLTVPVPIANEPVFRVGNPGPTAISVPVGGSMSITPGDYDTIRVGAGATLTLDGAGDYSAQYIALENSANLYVDGGSDDVEMLVRNSFRLARRAFVGPKPASLTTAEDIVVFVEGRNPVGTAGRIRRFGEFNGTMFVQMNGPAAALEPKTTIHGAVFATSISVGPDAVVSPSPFFPSDGGPGDADLSVTMTDDLDPAEPGDTISYVITVGNAGPRVAKNVVVADTLPAGVTLVSTAGCAEDPAGTPSCSLGDLASGASAQYTIQVAVDPGTTGTITNAATVSSDVVDLSTADNAVTEDTLVESADLSITKTDSSDPVKAGESLTYTVTVDNAGPSAATNVVVTDTLPAGVTLVSTTGCAEDPNGAPTCSLGTIAAGANASFDVAIVVDSNTLGTITNTATVISDIADPDAVNNTITEDTVVNTEADLSITKTDSADPVAPGDTVTYTVQVDNAGPSDAIGVEVTDTLPAGVTFVSTAGCTEDPSGVSTCTLGAIAASANASYTVEVTIDGSTSGVITNNATVTATTTDPNAANDTIGEPTTVEAVDLSITKTDSADPVKAGENITYTVTVDNAGPDDATNVVVTDTLPAGVTLVSTTGCAEDPNAAPTCTLGTIISGTNKQYTITVTVDSDTAAGTITNTATVTSDLADTNLVNNTITQDTVVNTEADLSITKTDSADPVPPGDTFTYTVTVVNSGPSDASGVVVTDTLPAGLTSVSTAGCGEDPNGAASCSLGTIASGDSASYTITADAPAVPGSITNTVTVATTTTDPNNANDTATEDTLIVAPVAPTGVADGPSMSSVPGDDFHTAFNTTLTVTTGTQVLLANDTLGNPPATLTSFGGGSLLGAVTDNSAGSSVNFGAGSLQVNGDGTFSFTPDTGFTGPFTFEYRLSNVAGTSDATVTIAVGVRAAASADARSSLGNVGLDTSLSPTFSVLTNDFGDGLSITAMDASSAQGGAITNLGAGQFTYTPPAGFGDGATDTFNYTMSNGFPGTSTAAVTITVNEVIWFIDNSGSAGAGTLASPFNTLAQFNSTLLDAAGHIVFISNTGSNYAGGIQPAGSLLAGQRVIGSGATGTFGSATGLVAVPPNTPTLPAVATTPPIIESASNGINLGSGNTIRGLNIGNTSGSGHGLAGGAVGALTVNEVSTSGSGGIIEVDTSGTLGVTFDSVASTSSSGGAIDLNNVSGTFTVVAGAGTETSISGSAVGISINVSTAIFNFGDTTVTNSSSTAVSLTANSGATINFGDLDITNSTSNQTGLFADSSGTVTTASGTINTGSGRAVHIIDTILDMTLTRVDSVNGSTPGIDLNETNGSFTVAGSGDGIVDCKNSVAACLGGSITGKAGGVNGVDGVLLTNVTNVSLNEMNISSNSRNGIFGTTVNGFTIDDSRLIDNTNQDNPNESAIDFDGLTGTAVAGSNPTRFSNIRVEDSVEHNVEIRNSSGTLTELRIENSTFSNDGGSALAANNLNFLSQGNASMGLNVQSSEFIGNRAAGSLTAFGIFADGQSTASLDVTVQNSFFEDNNAAVGVSHSGSGAVTFDISNNGGLDGGTPRPIMGNLSAAQAAGAGGASTAINVVMSTTYSGTASGVIHNNVIGDTNITESGSATGRGIVTDMDGSGTLTVEITNNKVNETDFNGIRAWTQETNGGDLFVKVTGNNLLDISSVGIYVRSRDGASNTLCAVVSGNTANATVTSDHARVRNDTGTVRLEGAGVDPTAALVANNPGMTAAQIDGYTSTVVGAGTCGF